MKKVLIYSLAFGLIISSCKPTELSDSKSYLLYLSNPDNGLVKEKSIAGLKYKIKYLPEDYQLINFMKGKDKIRKSEADSIRMIYANSITFLLNIGPAENEDFDVTRVGINSYEEFAERVEQMAFKAQEWISIVVKDKEYKPSIVRLENLNALERNRNFIVVFSSEKNSESDLRKEDICFIYNDELFNTGVNKFLFDSRDFEKIPEYKFKII